MADAVSAALDYKKGRWVFAADRAALDIVYGLTSDPELRKEWEREHSVDVLDYAERKGLGSKAYRLQKID